MKKNLTPFQKTYLKGDFSITHTCGRCGETKSSVAFTAGNGSICNLCKIRQKKTDQAFIDRKNKVIFDRDIRSANAEYEWPSDKELRL